MQISRCPLDKGVATGLHPETRNHARLTVEIVMDILLGLLLGSAFGFFSQRLHARLRTRNISLYVQDKPCLLCHDRGVFIVWSAKGPTDIRRCNFCKAITSDNAARRLFGSFYGSGNSAV